MYSNTNIKSIVAKAEASGQLGSSSTFNLLVNELSKVCNESNLSDVSTFLKKFDCAKNVTNVESILRQKAGLN
ncbi:hypothetical protein [Photobacterium ganghwense]|uniref:hypothetical protein n=1 Tax=Photobacterium ganghwense TaxID=320778 RepID=UPI001A8D496A|nr:hypothetical protein [Photobacterium ganghwense]QSV17324.1 hypothetical protein FH974_20575 [Photobacterium ganghwense]